MKIIRKRVLPFIMVLTLMIACSATAFAAETTVPVMNNANVSGTEIIPLASDHILGMHVSQKTSTSTKSGSFSIVSGVKKASLSVDITVSSPCTLFFFITDANGKDLGASSITITKAGSYTMIPSPSSLGSGNYRYEFMFDKSGINYSLYFKGTF